MKKYRLPAKLADYNFSFKEVINTSRNQLFYCLFITTLLGIYLIFNIVATTLCVYTANLIYENLQ